MIKVSHKSFISFSLSRFFFLFTALFFLSQTANAETWKLDESAHVNQTFEVSSELNVTGKIITAIKGGSASSMVLKANAKMNYLERKLSGVGRDAEAFRSMRIYKNAESIIDIHQRETRIQLRGPRKRIIAMGQREGVKFYSLDGSLRYSEIELLNSPGDSLAILPLLPEKEVSLGEKWECPGWSIQMLGSTEAVLKSDLTCELKSVKNQIARVEFTGKIEGATLGASSEIEISGHFLFDTNNSFIEYVELTQKEKRSVGAVSPGIDIEAVVKLDRKLIETPKDLADTEIAKIPLEPEGFSYLLEFQSPWKIQFLYDRNWHVFHQSNEFAVLRLLDKGSLIAQCNLSPIASVAAGSHTEEQVFQNDIRTALGTKLKSIEKAEQLKTDDGRFLYRVTVIGEVNELKMEWVYYLCASPTGQQVSFVFSYEQAQKEKLTNRDLDLVQNLKFLEQKLPQKAAE